LTIIDCLLFFAGTMLANGSSTAFSGGDFSSSVRRRDRADVAAVDD
jgi:hypothetical protein